MHLRTLHLPQLRAALSSKLRHPLLIGLLAILLLAFFLLKVDQPARPLYAQNALPNLRYSTTGINGPTITIGWAYNRAFPEEAPYVGDPSHPNAPKLAITLPQLLDWVQSKNYTPTLQALGNGVWQLDVNLVIQENARLDITAASGVEELRLISRPDDATTIIARGGWINIDGAKVYSWDNSPGVNDYDQTYVTVNEVMQTRAYLAALYGGRMDIKNAEIMHLGYEELNSRVGYGKGEPSGLSWRLLPTGATDPATGPKGSIIDSKVHHNYFGMYSYQAVGLVITGSEFYSHYFYGLDPHDYSYGFTIANNYIHDNGYTGLVLSRGCTDNVIYGNRIHNNKSHGILLDRGVNRNLVYDNEIIGSEYDGIVLYQSSYNQIYDNVIQNSGRYGIRISAEFDPDDVFDDVASDNLIQNNRVSASGKHGIYLLDRADRNQLVANQVSSSTETGILLNAGLTTVQGNTVTDNGKDGLLIDDKAYTGGTNVGGPSKSPLGQPGQGNQILANRFQRNAESGIQIDDGGNNRIGSLGAGNLLSENLDSGLLLKRTAATIIDSNEIRANQAGNGAGLNLSCVPETPVTHTIVNNIIADNLSSNGKGYGAGIWLGEGCFPQISGNWLDGNRNGSIIANLQNTNPAGSPAIQATDNLWGTIDAASAELGIWHQIDNAAIGLVNFLPLGTGALTPPATPIATPTAIATATPTLTPHVTSIATPVVTATPIGTPIGTPTPTATTIVIDEQGETLYLPLVTK